MNLPLSGHWCFPLFSIFLPSPTHHQLPYIKLLLSHLKKPLVTKSWYPLFTLFPYTTLFRSNLAQTDLAKKGTLDPGTHNSRGLSRLGEGILVSPQLCVLGGREHSPGLATPTERILPLV